MEAVTITLFLFPRQFNCYEDNNQLTPSFLFLSFDILNGFLMIVMSDFLMTYYSLLNLKSYSFFLQTIVMTITLFLFPRQFNCYEDNNQLTPNNVLSFTLTPLANVCLFSLVTVVCEPFMSHHKTF